MWRIVCNMHEVSSGELSEAVCSFSNNELKYVSMIIFV